MHHKSNRNENVAKKTMHQLYQYTSEYIHDLFAVFFSINI